MDLEQGQEMMKYELCKNNVLIVLDDVDHIYHLKMLVGSNTWFGNGSRIIFTTRNQDLVNAHGAITHNVRMLNDIEAIELFSKHAFGKRKPVQGFEKVSLKMVSKFGGHPLALIRLGFFLGGKNMGEWMSILNRIEDIPVAEILKKFKIGDDGVKREIFNRLPI
ncbi:disease resistance protein Roq1-like [Bidens hawaiensis]|uniref:disease resistance protein Roq1-like n=1 Tax=Bidens hawaiensis TaxID=980011 RepID=UPI004048EC43